MSANKSDRRDPSLKSEVVYEALDDTTTEDRSDLPKVGNPPRTGEPTSKDDFWTKAERITRIVASLGVMGAAGIGAMEYAASNKEQRSKRSLDIVQGWHQQDLDQDFSAVQVFVESRLVAVAPLIQQFEGEARELALANLARKWLLDNRVAAKPVQVEDHLNNLIQYYSQMEICIDAALCDEDVLRRYFTSEVESFWSYFSVYADLRREAGYSEYGALVTKLVERFESGKE